MEVSQRVPTHNSAKIASRKPRPRQFCGVPNCGRSFDRPAKLREHLRTHNDERPFECDKCGKAFAKKKHLDVHKLSHLDSKPHVCPQCGAGRSTKQQLERHLKTHDSQVHNCKHCGRQFKQKKSYANHIKQHVQCEICGVMQKDIAAQRVHIRRYHSQRYHCTLCNAKLDTIDLLRNHIKADHPKIGPIPEFVAFVTGVEYENRRFPCPNGCKKRFNRQYDLERHLRNCTNSEE